MNLIDSLLLAASVGLLIIGVDQTMKGFFLESYWVFMLLAIVLLSLRLRRNQAKTTSTNPPQKSQEGLRQSKKKSKKRKAR